MAAERVDVVVVGAGVHGASAAMHLAAAGAGVLVVERGEPAGGPTGRSSAVCRAYYTDPFLARVAREALDVLASFAEHTGGRDAGFHHTGGLFLHGPGDVDDVTRTVAALTAIGTRTDLLGPDELADRFPRFDLTGVACGAFEHGAGYADPVLTTTSMLERARELGATVRLRTAVTGLTLPRAGDGVAVGLSDGSTVSAGRVLVAAGPWTRPLIRQVGVDLPLTAERHVVATYAWGAAPPVGFVFSDVVKGFYFKPEPAELFLVGPLTPEPPIDDPDEVDGRIRDEEVTALAGTVVERVPDLEVVAPRGGWASVYDVSPDWQPVIGEVAPGVFVDAGTSGHGFKLAPALGREVAAMVLGEPDEGLAAFHPERFDAGRFLAAGFGDARILG